MACNNCDPGCTPTVILSSSSGCSHTMNSDCVLYTKETLSYEDPNVVDNSSRTLTTILQALENLSFKRQSKIVEFNTDGVSAYTLEAEDVNKIILLTQVEDGVVGTITNTITLPQTLDFADCEIIIKDISTPIDPNVTTIVFQFNIQVQYEWAPAATSNLMSVLMDATHKTLRLRFIKTTPTAYQWVVVP